MQYELRQNPSSKLKGDRETPTPKNAKPAQTLRFRLLLVWVLMMAGAVGLLMNLYQLQVLKAPMLEGKARQQQMVYLRPFIPRRPIVDRNNNVLAVDRPAYTLYVHPKLF